MIRVVADENLNGKLLRELIKLLPLLDIIRVQDTEIFQADDATVLAWAAKERRVLLTHDVQTLLNDAYKRIENGQPMPGVIAIADEASIGIVLNDLEVMIAAGGEEDFRNQVRYVPMH